MVALKLHAKIGAGHAEVQGGVTSFIWLRIRFVSFIQ